MAVRQQQQCVAAVKSCLLLWRHCWLCRHDCRRASETFVHTLTTSTTFHCWCRCSQTALLTVSRSHSSLTSSSSSSSSRVARTVVLQCYRRQAIPMKQAKIRPSVTLYSLDRSLPNLVRLITSAAPSQRPILVKFGWVGNSPQIGEI